MRVTVWRADVAAGADQERDEERQGDDLGQLGLEVLEDRAGVAGGHEQEEQPEDALADEERNARQAVGQVQRLRTTEALDVLGGLGLDDVGHVVLGDDPQQAVRVVHDGDGQQVAVGEQARSGLLVGRRPEPARCPAP